MIIKTGQITSDIIKIHRKTGQICHIRYNYGRNWYCILKIILWDISLMKEKRNGCNKEKRKKNAMAVINQHIKTGSLPRYIFCMGRRGISWTSTEISCCRLWLIRTIIWILWNLPEMGSIHLSFLHSATRCHFCGQKSCPCGEQWSVQEQQRGFCKEAGGDRGYISCHICRDGCGHQV